MWDPKPIWANSPFSLLSSVLKKIDEEGGHMILLCLGWRFSLKSIQEHPGVYHHTLSLLACGEVHPNPGPGRSTKTSGVAPGRKHPYLKDFKLVPRIFEAIPKIWGCPRPMVDAFVAVHDKQLPAFWDVGVDAFSQNWNRPNPIWMNLPFRLFPEGL